jgi:hypothetical protein
VNQIAFGQIRCFLGIWSISKEFGSSLNADHGLCDPKLGSMSAFRHGLKRFLRQQLPLSSTFCFMIRSVPGKLLEPEHQTATAKKCARHLQANQQQSSVEADSILESSGKHTNVDLEGVVLHTQMY